MSGEPTPSQPSQSRASQSQAIQSREEAKRATRRALLEAALAEFAGHGLDAPSLDGICARAGFTRGAFYVHFRDREDLVAAAMEHALSVFLDAVISGDGAAGDLEAVIERYVVLAADGLEDLDRKGSKNAARSGAGVPFHQVMAACQRNEDVRRRFVSILTNARERVAVATEAAQEAGRARSDPDAGDQAQLLVLLALGVSAAADLRLPLHVGRTRDALLKLLRGSDPERS